MPRRGLLPAIAMMAASAAGCATAPTDARRATPVYDPFTGRLTQLRADQNNDGTVDQWTYLDGNRPLRGEADTDGDGRIDRWEYFDAKAQLTHVGTSSRNDGIEDTWTYPDTGGERRLARSTGRDRRIDRQEFYNGDTLARVEEDTNRDGRADKWERYENAVLREAGFDIAHSSGRPTRRVRYDDAGRFVAIEDDPEGDGTFAALTGAAAEAARAGVKR